MVQLDDLNPFARGFAVALFAVRPDWQGFAAVETGEHAEPGCLALSVSAPANVDRHLWIGTWAEEVTVGFGRHGWHAHFGRYLDMDHAQSYRAAIQEIEAIVSDRLTILTKFRHGRMTSSETLWADDAPEFGEADWVEIESWSGSRDATLFPA